MTTLSNYYGLTGTLPFIDVDIDDDNTIFVDPLAIRLSSGPSPYRVEALQCMDSFMDRVTTLITKGTAKSLEEARKLLGSFKEPWETRLGYAQAGYFGHGGASHLGDELWNELKTNLLALVQVGMLRQIERIPSFVKGVAADVTSDLTTRIIYASLVHFTTDMMALYPALRVGVKTHLARLWDVSTNRWVEREVSLPAPNGTPVLLVPVGWARRNHLMTASRYCGVTVLGHVQRREAVFSKQTKRWIRTPKDQLKKREDLKDVVPTNIRVTLEAHAEGRNLPAEYETYIADWLSKNGL